MADDIKQQVKKITAKDERQAVEALTGMIDNADVEMFKELVAQSDYLFPFVKDNVCKRFEMSIKGSNFNNIFAFLDCYSPDYDRVFANALKVFGGDTINAKMLNLLKNGSVAQKTYAARFFEMYKNIAAVRELIAYAFSDDEYLSDACAAALGVLCEQKSYDTALEKLNSDDDFEALKGLDFFVSYIKNPPMEDIFDAMKKSGMPENFAGKIAYLTPLPKLVQEDLKNALIVVDNILTGFGEILPLSEVFNFELYDVLGMLSEVPENEYFSQVATVLLKAKSKFDTICGNDEYIFDEDKNTKDEIAEIGRLLDGFGNGFWSKLKNAVKGELNAEKSRVLSALAVIKDYEIKDAISAILDMIYETEDETDICEGLSTLKQLDALSYMPKDEVIPRLSNETIRAVALSYYN